MALHLKSTGLDFADFGSGTGSMVNELLDDYEEGTWTATFGQCDLSGGSRYGRYTKVGDTLIAWFDVTGVISNISSGPTITGLPFAAAVAAAGGGYGAPVFRAANAVGSDLRIYGSSSYHNSSVIQLTSYNSSGVEGTQSWQAGDLRMTGRTQYFTAT
jgi:hypothetical protein